MKKRGKVTLSTEELEHFQQYLFEMHDVLDDFVREAADVGYVLDYSIPSLDVLEHYICSLGAVTDGRLRNRVARYLGETFRRNIGGRWDISLDAPEYLNSKLPIITDYSDLEIDFCPLEVTENFLVRRAGGTFRQAVESHLEFARR